MPEQTQTAPSPTPPPQVATARSGGERYLSFSLGEEEFAIPLMRVKEVIAYTDITPVPYAPPHFQGIMNLRGQVVSVFDLRTKLRFAAADRGPETAIIILDLAPLSVGVVVDSVNSVVPVPAEAVSPPPDVDSGRSVECIQGVAHRDKQLILLLDIDKTLSVEDLKVAHEQTNRKFS